MQCLIVFVSPTTFGLRLHDQAGPYILTAEPQYLYDPGILIGLANECTLGNVYLRSNLSRILSAEQLG